MIDRFEKVAKALGSASRIRILKLLETGELCVCQITEVLDLSPATVSKHLSLLRDAGLIDSRQDGKWIYYCLPTPPNAPYAELALEMIGDVLGDDPVVAADLSRLGETRDDLIAEESRDGGTPCGPLRICR